MKKIVRISSILFVATPLMLLNSPKVEAALFFFQAEDGIRDCEG